MPSLRDSVSRVPLTRPTDLGNLLAQHLRVTDPTNPLSGLEASALAIAVAVLKASGRQLREEMLRERSRSHRLEQLVHRLPAAPRGGHS